MSELSPAARAVWEAAMNTPDHMPYEYDIAAALCATADQVFPLERTPWGSRLIPILTSQESRDRLLAIAAELKNHQ